MRKGKRRQLLRHLRGAGLRGPGTRVLAPDDRGSWARGSELQATPLRRAEDTLNSARSRTRAAVGRLDEHTPVSIGVARLPGCGTRARLWVSFGDNLSPD